LPIAQLDRCRSGHVLRLVPANAIHVIHQVQQNPTVLRTPHISKLLSVPSLALATHLCDRLFVLPLDGA